MGTRDPRVDAYIAGAAPFAQPILSHLRALVHEGCPGATESIKWGMPFFLNGKSMLCNMAAFKEHCTFGFWKGSQVVGEDATDGAQGQFGRIASLSDLPADEALIGYVRKAVAMHEAGAKPPARPKPAGRRELVVPPELTEALERNEAARKTFEGFSHTNKKEYADWIAEAKTDATRRKRLETAVEWMAEGKPRMWKYQK